MSEASPPERDRHQEFWDISRAAEGMTDQTVLRKISDHAPDFLLK